MTITLNTANEAAQREYTIANPFAATAGRVRLAAEGLAEAMATIEAFSMGKLEPKVDLFGETLSPEDQMKNATVKATEMVAIIDSRITRHA